MGTQHLAHDDAHGVAHGQEHDVGEVRQGGGDGKGGHHIQAPDGVALVQEGDAGRPEELVQKQGHALDGDEREELFGNVEGSVGTPDERVDDRIGVVT